jgi:hypothetical protein
MKAPNRAVEGEVLPNKSSGPMDAGALPADQPPTHAEDCERLTW